MANRKRIAAGVLSGISAVAVGLIVVSLVRDTPAPPVEASGGSDEAAPDYSPNPTEAVVVTPEIAYPVEIPGCDTVEPPAERSTFSWVRGSYDLPSYDNPRFPWLTGEKATAMSDALHAALPTDVEVVFASPRDMLLFGPIDDFEDALPPDAPDGDYGGWTDARGALARGDAYGQLSVSVRKSHRQPPPCVAGMLDQRISLDDGSVVDTFDTWKEVDGVRTLIRNAYAHLPDGTQVIVRLDDTTPHTSDLSNRNSGALPLTTDEMVSLATAPGLRVTNPVPPGTLPASPLCNASPVSDGPPMDRETIDRLNRVLDEVRLTVQLDRPLGSLQIADFGNHAACTSVNLGDTHGTALGVWIGRGYEVPAPLDEYDPGRRFDTREVTMLPSGAAMEQDDNLVQTADPDPVAETETHRHRSVTVTWPSGTRVHVWSTAPDDVVTTDVLEQVATTPGLDLE